MKQETGKAKYGRAFEQCQRQECGTDAASKVRSQEIKLSGINFSEWHKTVRKGAMRNSTDEMRRCYSELIVLKKKMM